MCAVWYGNNNIYLKQDIRNNSEVEKRHSNNNNIDNNSGNLLIQQIHAQSSKQYADKIQHL